MDTKQENYNSSQQGTDMYRQESLCVGLYKTSVDGCIALAYKMRIWDTSHLQENVGLPQKPSKYCPLHWTLCLIVNQSIIGAPWNLQELPARAWSRGHLAHACLISWLYCALFEGRGHRFLPSVSAKVFLEWIIIFSRCVELGNFSNPFGIYYHIWLFFSLATQDQNPPPVMGNSPHSEAESTSHQRGWKYHVHVFPSLPVSGQGPLT